MKKGSERCRNENSDKIVMHKGDDDDSVDTPRKH